MIAPHEISENALTQLKKIDNCDIKSDALTLGIYSTDASLYQLKPLAVAIPHNEQALVELVKIAYLNDIPIMPRGSATSLAGQTTNRALIIDMTQHFNKILEVNSKEKYSVVQPGVVRDQLNAAAASHGLHFSPDPATSSRATIGGMIANNSSGTKSIMYGKTIDHVLELKVLLSDGTIIHTQELTQEEYNDLCLSDNNLSKIYRNFRQVIYDNAEDIKEVFPKVLRRVQGYPLDEFVYTDRWNLSKLFSGSEGSLGIILEAKVNLDPIPQHKAAFTLHYTDRMQAIKEVQHIIKFQPAAVEMLDYNVFVQSKKNPLTRDIHQRLIEGEPQATLSVEFFCLSADELNHKISEFKAWINTESNSYASPLLRTPQELEDSWTLRKNGLGLIMGDPDGRKPIPFIEDMAIDPVSLPDYIGEVLELCDAKGVETILYAHASVGVLHVRPNLDMTQQEDIVLMQEISEHVFQLVKKYKGSWSGEHGDGRNRGHRLKDFFGEKVYHALREVKNIFDPKNLLNPGIIIDVPPMDQNLRYGPEYKDKDQDYVYHYRKDHSFGALVHNCSGVGACRNLQGGTMCPSFRATHEEVESTRGRANALRLAMSGQLGFDDLTDPKVLDALDLCLSCKACKAECPSSVDMAKLKSEVLQKKYDKGLISAKERAILYNDRMARFLSGLLSPIHNLFIKTSLFKWIGHQFLGVDKRRTLPPYTQETLATWYQKHYSLKGYKDKVALFNDTYINFHEPHIGIAAIKLLNDSGFEVELADVGCCQRPKISNGFLKVAKSEGTLMAQKLKLFIDKGMKVVVCEPSCTSALIDDLPDLIDDVNLAHLLQNNVMAIDEFVSDALDKGFINGHLKAKSNSVWLHGHCHQKSTTGINGMKKIFQNMEHVEFSCPDNGCCGMAGSFGYEKDHYDVSKKIAESRLIPAINQTKDETLIVANGFSCRHQIMDFSDKKPIHWVESVEVVKD